MAGDILCRTENCTFLSFILKCKIKFYINSKHEFEIYTDFTGAPDGLGKHLRPAGLKIPQAKARKQATFFPKKTFWYGPLFITLPFPKKCAL